MPAQAGAPIVDPPIDWRASRAVGQPFAGRLVRGVQLPARGRDFWTYDWGTRARPTGPGGAGAPIGSSAGCYASLRDYRSANPGAPRVGVADLSRPHGGAFGRNFGGLGHASHQNGLDVDIVYPRRDRARAADPRSPRGGPGAGPGPRRTASSRRAPRTSGPARASTCAGPPASSRTSSTTTTTCTSGSADPARPAVSPRRCRGRPAGRRPRATRPASRRSAARGPRARRRSRAPPCARRRAACRCRAPPPRAR